MEIEGIGLVMKDRKKFLVFRFGFDLGLSWNNFKGLLI